MAGIGEDDEWCIDWDWYAVDVDGNIGHFTSAGLRLLPRSVKADEQRARSLIDFFSGLADTTVPRVCIPINEQPRSFGSEAGRSRYLKSFAEMGSKGLFSFDTQMLHGRDAKYFKVAVPVMPLRLEQLPADVQTQLLVTRANVKFSDCVYVDESATLKW
jgi:hypothetical protein